MCTPDWSIDKKLTAPMAFLRRGSDCKKVQPFWTSREAERASSKAEIIISTCCAFRVELVCSLCVMNDWSLQTRPERCEYPPASLGVAGDVMHRRYIASERVARSRCNNSSLPCSMGSPYVRFEAGAHSDELHVGNAESFLLGRVAYGFWHHTSLYRAYQVELEKLTVEAELAHFDVVLEWQRADSELAAKSNAAFRDALLVHEIDRDGNRRQWGLILPLVWLVQDYHCTNYLRVPLFHDHVSRLVRKE